MPPRVDVESIRQLGCAKQPIHLDLLGRGLSSTITEVEAIIREICTAREEDGIVFDSESVEGARIKEDDEYDGARVKFQAELAGARIPMQVDIGFGDAVYPEPELASFPVLLPMEAPLIRAYPREARSLKSFTQWLCSTSAIAA